MRHVPREADEGDPHTREKEQQIDLSGREPPPRLPLTRERVGRGDPLVDRVHGGLEPGRVALLAEARRERLADDLGGGGVRQRRLEPVADLDAHLPVLDEQDEQDTVVERLRAETPLLEEPVRDVLDALPVERFEHRDRHLRPGGTLALRQERLEPFALGRGQEPGVVVHMAGRRGRQDESNDEDNREEQARISPWAGWPRRAPPRRTVWAESRKSRRRASPGRGEGGCCIRARTR